jgi:broad specificity phosphatase PhoE
MSTRAIMVRHGESVSNADPEMASLPLEEGDRLTERGREQARLAGEALAGLEPTALLSSTMGRAIETAEIIAETIGLPIVEIPYITELRESRDYDSMSAEEQKLRRWSVWMREHGDDPDFSWHGGESFEQVRGRVRRLKDELESEHDGGRPLVVTHGIFLRFFLFDSLLGDAFGPDQAARLWFLRSLNCGVSVFEHGERWHPVDAETPGWTCLSWMSRAWDPP